MQTKYTGHGHIATVGGCRPTGPRHVHVLISLLIADHILLQSAYDQQAFRFRAARNALAPLTSKSTTNRQEFDEVWSRAI